MIFSLVVFGLSLAAFFYLRRSITRDHQAQRDEYKRQHHSLVQEYESLCAQKNRLVAEASALNSKINKLKDKHSPEERFSPPPNVKARPKRSTTEEASSFMLANGLISVEQHQKVISTMKTLKLDFISTCLTLGFIDQNTALELGKRYRNDH